MWYLYNKTGDKYYYLCGESNVFVVGRGLSNVDIQLKEDPSISREHASLTLKKSGNNVNVILIDKGSKYGTYMNNGIQSKTHVTSGQEIPLKEGDRIRFGILLNEWILAKKDIRIATSAFTIENQNKIKEILKLLSGEYEELFNVTCTHLTVRNFAITLKIVQALVSATPIVTIDYWTEFLSCVNSNKPWPKEELFLPKQSDPLIKFDSATLFPRIERKHLFANKTFVFLSSKQHNLFEQIISSAQGKTILLHKSKITKSQICQPGMIVVQYIKSNNSQTSQSSQSSHTLDEIERLLEKQKLRLIPESEIGLAILSCSTETYCNPAYNFKNSLVRPSTVVEVHEVLAEETEQSPKRNVVNSVSGNMPNLQIQTEMDISIDELQNDESNKNSNINKITEIDNIHNNSNSMKNTASSLSGVKPLNTLSSKVSESNKVMDNSIITYNTTKKRNVDCMKACTDTDSDEEIMPATKIAKNNDENEDLFCFENEEKIVEAPKLKKPRKTCVKTENVHKNDMDSVVHLNTNKDISNAQVSIIQVSCNNTSTNTSNISKDVTSNLHGWLSSNGNSMELDITIKKEEEFLNMPSEYQEWITQMRKGINVERRRIQKKVEVIHKSIEKHPAGVNYKYFRKVRPLFY